MKNKADNYLDKIPVKNEKIGWSADEKGIVTLEIENKGVFNKVFQLILKKPKITYIHLDEMGSFVWPLIDGKKDVIAIGKEVKEHFGEKANPLYERLSQFFVVLDSYKFVSFKK